MRPNVELLKNQSGLTLLELMLTLVIFSSIIGLLMNSFVQLRQQNELVQTILTLRQETRVLEQLLKEDILSAVYLHEYMNMAGKTLDGRKSGIVGINNSYEEFDMDAIHMHVHNKSKFQRTMAYSDDPELYEVSYYLDTDDIEHPQFMRREEIYIDSDIMDGDRSITHTLSQRVVSFNMEYFEGNNSEEEEEWDSSQKNGLLPSGLKITIKLKDEKDKTLESEFQINLRPSIGAYTTWE